MPQYFDNPEGLAHRDIALAFTLLGERYSLRSDNGVFSKNRLDFGTRFLLETILDFARDASILGTEILDLGCGAGPIGLILAHLDPTRHVTLSDVNERALDLARQNAAILGVQERVKIVASDVYRNIDSTYDSILSNPPIRAGKRVTYRIYDEAPAHLREGGSLFLVIRKEQGASSVRDYLLPRFEEVLLLGRKKGYCVMQARKKRSNTHAN